MIARVQEQAYFVRVRRESAMKRTAVVLACLLTSLPLAAQSTSQLKTTILSKPSQTVAPCPIGMQARQGVWDHTMRVRNGDQEKIIQPFGQRFFLTLKDSHPARIVSATLRIHGTDGKSRMLQATVANNTTAEAAKIVTVPFKAKDGGVSADVYVPGFTSVSSVELQQVIYADGSTWKKSASSVCRVAPDPLMLVAEH
jgi:hypothetical protein